jgi:NitT/TauT family transport system ATP-binding protein
MFSRMRFCPEDRPRKIQLGLTFRGKTGPMRREPRPGSIGLASVWRSPPIPVKRRNANVSLAQCWIVEPDMVLMTSHPALVVHTRLRMESCPRLMDRIEDGHLVTHDLEEAISLSTKYSCYPRDGSRLVGRFAVDLARPRNLIDIKTEPGSTNYSVVSGRPATGSPEQL